MWWSLKIFSDWISANGPFSFDWKTIASISIFEIFGLNTLLYHCIEVPSSFRLFKKWYKEIHIYFIKITLWTIHRNSGPNYCQYLSDWVCKERYNITCRCGSDTLRTAGLRTAVQNVHIKFTLSTDTYSVGDFMEKLRKQFCSKGKSCKFLKLKTSTCLYQNITSL